MTHRTVAFIGGGQMAQALCGGGVQANLLKPSQIVFVEPHAEQQQKLRGSFPESHIVADAAAALDTAETVFLSVKPQVLQQIAHELAPLLSPKQLVISIAAGISLEQLRQWLGTSRIVRIMPNTPAQIGAGAAALAADAGASEDDVAWAEQLMQAVGTCVRVPDGLMHAVTGLSGSGPAYIYLVIEALSDGGVAMGLPRNLATQLAAQTVCGAARMVLETGEHPGRLKDQVTSPGGTTIAAMRTLEAAGTRSAFIEAVASATQRSQELS